MTADRGEGEEGEARNRREEKESRRTLGAFAICIPAGVHLQRPVAIRWHKDWLQGYRELLARTPFFSPFSLCSLHTPLPPSPSLPPSPVRRQSVPLLPTTLPAISFCLFEPANAVNDLEIHRWNNSSTFRRAVPTADLPTMLPRSLLFLSMTANLFPNGDLSLEFFEDRRIRSCFLFLSFFLVSFSVLFERSIDGNFRFSRWKFSTIFRENSGRSLRL